MRLSWLVPGVLMGACVEGAVPLDGEERDSRGSTEYIDGSGSPGDDTEDIGDNGEPDADDEDQDDGVWPDACPSVYDPDTLQTFELTFDEDVLADVRADCQRGAQVYRPVQLTYEGETVAAMARLKGNWSWSCDKLQFVVSFNEEDATGRFRGLRKLMFDAPWYDHTLLHERLANELFAARGLPHSCANSAQLVVNGGDYGVYTNIERIDEEYLERNFELSDGNLYQGGSELKTNEDVGDTTNLQALQGATTVDEIAALVDLDQAVAEWATEAMIPALDNYWAGVEINYYLYDHPARGFVYLPYDLDISFGDSAYPGGGGLIWPDAVNADPLTYEHGGWGKEALVKIVLADEAWCERFVDEVALARAAFVPEEIAARAGEWQAQIGDAVAADTRKAFSTAEHEAAVVALQAFVGRRAAFVDAWLEQGGHCPARW